MYGHALHLSSLRDLADGVVVSFLGLKSEANTCRGSATLGQRVNALFSQNVLTNANMAASFPNSVAGFRRRATKVDSSGVNGITY